MSTQSPSQAEKRPRRGYVQQRVYTETLKRIGPHLRRSKLSKAQKNMALTGFVLGACSILFAIFPICSFPMGVAGLLLGLQGRRTPAMHTIATWSAALSVIGLALTFVCMLLSLGVYFGRHPWF